MKKNTNTRQKERKKVNSEQIHIHISNRKRIIPRMNHVEERYRNEKNYWISDHRREFFGTSIYLRLFVSSWTLLLMATLCQNLRTFDNVVRCLLLFCYCNLNNKLSSTWRLNSKRWDMRLNWMFHQFCSISSNK